jgi:uncharacterized HAD superfamily protein
MRLGFDLDNVLANLMDPLNDHLNEKFDIEFIPEMWTSRTIEDLELDLGEGLQKEIAREVVHTVYDIEFLKSLAPCEGAKSVIDFLRRKGNEIYVITARKLEAFDISSEWLKVHGIYFDALICTKFKPRVAWNYGVRTFVDDDYDTLLKFADFRQAKFFRKLIVMSYPYNTGLQDKRIERANNMHEVLAKLEIRGRDVCDL